MPHTNAAGQSIIKNAEGLSLVAYPDPGTGGDPWTIGRGHTGSCAVIGLGDVAPGMTITEAQADALFAADLAKFETGVNDLCARSATPNQFSAMVSLAYNIGLGAFADSTVLREFNAGNDAAAADAFGLWVNGADGPLPGLVTRRAAEKSLFLTP